MMPMMPGVGPQIKDALSTLKRISDSKRRANALKGYEILIDYHNKHGNTEDVDDCIARVNDIIYSEYGMYKSASKS